jgi:hypothetical protein
MAHKDLQRLVVGGQAINQLLLRAFSHEMGIDQWRCQDSESPCESCHLEITLWWGDRLDELAQSPLEGLKYAIEEVTPGSAISFPIGNPCRSWQSVSTSFVEHYSPIFHYTSAWRN